MKSMLEEAMARSASGPVTEDSRVDAELEELLSKMRTNIKIVGVGGGGTNTIGRIHEEGVVGAELFAANTDAQHLLAIKAPKKILLGRRVTRGLGAGALPQIGEEAAREAEEELKAALQGSDIVFITCGLGGGTGTGGAGGVAPPPEEGGAPTGAVVTPPLRGGGERGGGAAGGGLRRGPGTPRTAVTHPHR